MSRSHQQQADARREMEAPPELESQFILRMPEEPSKVLRELLRSGANLKDRCTIRLENDMRYGEVRIDHWLMHAKVIDLPTIIESLKTIDSKSFYKTADICQMMICKEEADQPSAEEEVSNKNKKKDPFKVEKKFLWPHGVTPPTKNVRKRRFRKTLKKKYVEAPEIEKEVKRLLRIDNDAVSVKWEVLSEEEEQQTVKGEPASHPSNTDQGEVTIKKEKVSKVKQDLKIPKREQNIKNELTSDTANVDVEHDIFGGAVSDSDEEMGSTLNVELNDNSRLSEYDSRLSDSTSLQGVHLSDTKNNLPTQFASDMFQGENRNKWNESPSSGNTIKTGHPSHASTSEEYQNQSMNKENIQLQLEQLSSELENLRSQRVKKEQEVASMENLALRQRFQEFLDNLNQDIMYKEMEYQELQAILQQTD